MSEQTHADFAKLVVYIESALTEAEGFCEDREYPKATGHLIGSLRFLLTDLRNMTSDKLFCLVERDPSTLFLEWVSTDIYNDSIEEFFDDECLEAAADLVGEEVLEDAEFRAAFVSLAKKKWATCPLARERMHEDARDVESARDRFMDGYGHRRDATIQEWCNEITDESFLTEVVALMAHRKQEHLRQVAAWRGDPHNPINEDSDASPSEEKHV